MAMRDTSGKPYRTTRRDYPGPAVGAHVQHAGTGINELMFRVVMPVNAFAVFQVPAGRTRKRMAAYQHWKPVYW